MKKSGRNYLSQELIYTLSRLRIRFKKAVIPRYAQDKIRFLNGLLMLLIRVRGKGVEVVEEDLIQVHIQPHLQ